MATAPPQLLDRLAGEAHLWLAQAVFGNISLVLTQHRPASLAILELMSRMKAASCSTLVGIRRMWQGLLR